ncbi:hypothetical protein [Nocardia terpenica]|uniref:Head-to-tail stopper n=1 Tax=Nocardia terpenica TaxID=455432 RepID=A0A161WF67_9NOCA|nr:hypothetical protein [Nocardia terpenica]KZM75559.1 hypothetical protein AWN90_19475 [Nocardia terpenica]NQE86039.1 hypothetical protein [Nocardia terpenica]
MSFPLRGVVGHHRYRDGGLDAHGNPVPSYTPPLDAPGTPVAVYGWGPARSAEPALPGHDRVIIDVKIYVPADFSPAPRDLVDLPAGPAGRFEVVGIAGDANHGPFGWVPGNVIAVRKVDG